MSTASPRSTQPDLDQCIVDCTACYQVCLETLQYCLQMGGPHVAREHVTLMLDCVEICQTAANFMLRGSQWHVLTCGVCAEICEACARDCDRLGDEVMRRCAEVCRRCAESCRRMAGGAGAMPRAA